MVAPVLDDLEGPRISLYDLCLASDSRQGRLGGRLVEYSAVNIRSRLWDAVNDDLSHTREMQCVCTARA